MAKKSPFPPKSMLKSVQILSTLTLTSCIGSTRISLVVSAISNIDLGGRGELNGGSTVSANIFGDHCLGSMVELNLTLNVSFSL